MHRMSLTSLAWLMRILAVTKVRIHVSDSRRYTIAVVSVLNRLRNPISTRLDLLYATRVSLHPRRNISMPVRWLDESINTCTHVSLVEKARIRAMGTVVKKKEREKRYNSQPVERPRIEKFMSRFFRSGLELREYSWTRCTARANRLRQVRR